jgi:hypothetical protein
MRWQVDGAEAATGKETSLTIEALTAAEAEQQARYNGILVSRVERTDKPAPGLTYAPAHGFDKPVAPAAPEAPEYRAIQNGAWFLRLFGGIAHATGVVVAGLGVVAAVRIIVVARRDGGPVGPDSYRMAAALAGLGALWAFMYFAAGSVLKMLAAVAEAVRDIARNSFRR